MTKQIWEIINLETRRKIKNKGICLKIGDKTLNNTLYIAEAFNKYFLSIAKNNNYKTLHYSQKMM
jgi:hypothetical protein